MTKTDYRLQAAKFSIYNEKVNNVINGCRVRLEELAKMMQQCQKEIDALQAILYPSQAQSLYTGEVCGMCGSKLIAINDFDYRAMCEGCGKGYLKEVS